MPVHSAGILLYRGHGREREVFLVHPGGPFWTKKDEGAWSVPKGIVDPNEDPLAAARREFKEETGFQVDGEFRDLGIFRQPSNKRIHVWVLEGGLRGWRENGLPVSQSPETPEAVAERLGVRLPA